MKALNIQYQGKGSEKQIAWAAEIFNQEIKKIADFRATAESRVNNGSMPEKWLKIIDEILADERIINAIKQYSLQDASTTINYKAFCPKGMPVSIAGKIEKIAIKQYQA